MARRWIISVHAFAHQNPGVRLLRHLRDIMGGAVLSPTEKLVKIAHLIASDMDTDVCCIYVVKNDGHLHLIASYGVAHSAVPEKSLPVGEGIIGMIAAEKSPILLSDFKHHPAFQQNPHLDDDTLSSFLGVPLMRSGRSMGVLALKNKYERTFSMDDLDLMQTIAMVLSELLSSYDASVQTHHDTSPLDPHRTVILHGLSLNGGMVKGRAVLHHPQLSITQLLADDVPKERKNFDKALKQMQESIKGMIDRLPHGSTERRGILETYQMFASDRGWIAKIRRAIDSGLTTEAAIQKVQRDLRRSMGQITDPLLKERLWDLEDLSRRLLRHVLGDNLPFQQHMAELTQKTSDVILVAQSMGPAELLDYATYKIKGLILEEGLQTAHVAIVARSLNIPVVSRIMDGVFKIQPNEELIVDGDMGHVILRPNNHAKQQYEKRRSSLSRRLENETALLSAPAITADGTTVSLYLNGGLPMDVDRLSAMHVQGIGLYRTEIPFMMAAELPSVSAQTKLYRSLLDKAGSKTLVFRTLDVGGDKMLPYFDMQKEENPALGWRAIRLGLDRPMILRQQLRAMIDASTGKVLRLMFPMVASAAEFLEARHVLDLELSKAKSPGPKKLMVGIMLEVPSAVWHLDTILPHLDFVSVGTNDLSQFFFAADRSNPRLSLRYDVLSPPFLSLLQHIVITCKKFHRPLSICGEMAGHPLDALVLLALGFRHLSVHWGAVAALKAMIQQVPLPHITSFLTKNLTSSKKTLRNDLRHYALDHKIPV